MAVPGARERAPAKRTPTKDSGTSTKRTPAKELGTTTKKENPDRGSTGFVTTRANPQCKRGRLDADKWGSFSASGISRKGGDTMLHWLLIELWNLRALALELILLAAINRMSDRAGQ